MSAPRKARGGVSFYARPSVPPPIRRLRLGRALAEAVCVVCGFAGFAMLVLVLS
jgi:hypothetical protein